MDDEGGAAAPLVFEAFVRPEMMSAFWFHRRDDGLEQGETVRWYLGTGADAFGFDVRVKVVDPPRRLEVEWGDEEGFTTVTWKLEHEGSGTLLTIEESGFQGEDRDVAARVLDPTRGFNQVIVAAKALIEHGVKITVADDQAPGG